MLYLILGNNKQLIEKWVKKVSKNLALLKMDQFNFDSAILRGELESVSLFGGQENAIFLSDISDNSDHFEFLESFISILISSSKNVFIVESNLLKTDLEIFESKGVEIIDLREKKEKEWGYSPFALQDAIGERNIKNIWVEYQKLRQLGIESEDLIHKVMSKVRDMNAILKGATKEDLAIKSDFPFNKSKRDLKNWKPADLENFYTKLVSIYHESRMGVEELDLALEKALLSL